MKAVLEYLKKEQKEGPNGPYEKMSIKIRGKFYNGFGSELTNDWKVGKTVDVDLYETEYNGKMYDNFTPMEPDMSDANFAELEKRVHNIEKFLKKRFMEGVAEPKPPEFDEDKTPLPLDKPTPAKTKAEAKEAKEDLPWE